MIKGSLKKKILAILLVLCVLAGLAGYVFYRAFYYPSVRFAEKSRVIFIHTGDKFDDVMYTLISRRIVRSPRAFKMLAGMKGYKTRIKPGRYRIMNHISNSELLEELMSGNQEPETISLFNLRTKREVVDILFSKMETDSATIVRGFSDSALKKYGFTTSTVIAMFFPGTYQMLWTDTPDAFLERMHKIYKDFWTPERRKQAAAIPLTPMQVSILASIVQAEQGQNEDEKPVIAGLYINRIKKGIHLQSDPTLIYARGDFSITRVLDIDKNINSPYNTYMYTGLPPGPINMPAASSIDAVLHYQKNDYIYMCAESDFSGRHHFSKTMKEQEEYAVKYQKALNKRSIMR